MLTYFLLILIIFVEDSRECTCDGIEVQLSDQQHCFQIIRNTGGSWVNADRKCSSIGGFLAHINNASLYTQLENYVVQNYQKPLMTGATVANIDLDLVALMCPANTFYSLLDNSFVASFFNGTPGDADRCTFFTNDESTQLHYMPCNTSADILCDRPMERVNYCNIVMNCTSTTTVTSTTSTTPSTTTTMTSTSTPTSTSTATTATTRTSTSTAATTAIVIPINTTAASASTTKTSSATSPTTTVINNTTAVSTTTTTATTPTSTSTTRNTGSTSTGPTTTAAIATTKTTTAAAIPATTSQSKDQCGGDKKYTRVFGWCVPWWCWLIIGLLALGLLLCFLSWCCHFCNAACLCSHQKETIYPPDAVKSVHFPSESVACQTEPFLMPKGETVYVPVPKTPPPSQERVVIKEVDRPVHTHTVFHTKEIYHEQSPHPPQQPIVYDVTVYENAFNKNTVVIPPAVQQPEPVPTLFLPPPATNFDDDGISANSMPYLHEDEDPILPIVPMAIVPVVPPHFEPKPKKRRGRPISPLKHNRPPLGGLHPKIPKHEAPIVEEPRSRDFPRRPASAGSNREFPGAPPDSPKQRSVTPPEGNRPIRRNSPLGIPRNPDRLSRTPPERGPAPDVTKRPIGSYFHDSPRKNGNDLEQGLNRAPRSRSPENRRLPPPPQPPAAPSPKPPTTQRVSPLHDSPTKLPSSPRKFRSPSPNLSNQPMTAPSNNQNSNNNTRRRSPLPGFGGEANGNSGKNSGSMQDPNGRLGGAVYGRPEGWKPWGKSPQPFSTHPGFLDNDN